jgi:hypothetical protein
MKREFDGETTEEAAEIELPPIPSGTEATSSSQRTSKSGGPKKPFVADSPYSLASWIYEFLEDWAFTTVIGFLVVSYWRGTWTLLDLYSCGQPQDASLVQGNTFCFGVEVNNPTRIRSAWGSYVVGIGLLALGIALFWSGLWIPKETLEVTYIKALQRTIMVYILGAAAVNLWRGIWYLTDHLLLPDEPLTSWWITSSFGSAGAFLLCSGASLLASPAIFNMDGPGLNPPPLAVTILSSYYSITLSYNKDPPRLLWITHHIDIVLSFVVLPIFVVWFWRGSWFLMDNYLWGLTPNENDLHLSMAYGTALAYGLLFIGSDDIVSTIPSRSLWASQVSGRLRSLLLAVGTVSFWRVVWYLWDEFFGGTSTWSAWLAHFGSVGGLLVMGCLSCIAAPPSTLGVDAIAHEECADEPLFQDVPIPAESSFLFAIGRNPHVKIQEAQIVPAVSAEQPKFILLRQRPEFGPSGTNRLARLDDDSVTRKLRSRNSKKRLQNQFFRSR